MSFQCTPYKFTSKELDEETGLYYYGARYYDSRLSRWVSADPAMSTGEYFPVPPINNEAKEKNKKLSGVGGIFNSINLNLYHYAANNPVKFIDPDGLKIYNITIKGGGPNIFGHSLILHVDDKTGKATYYEVTGPNSRNVNVQKRTVEEFKEHYRGRLDKLDEAFDKHDFDPKKSVDGYTVIEVKGVNETDLLSHVENLHETNGPGKNLYPYDAKNNNCAKFNFEAYKKGGKKFSPETSNVGENPERYPRDLHEAIEYHNDTDEKKK